MRTTFVATIVGTIIVLGSTCAVAQQALPPQQKGGVLELKQEITPTRPPIIRPTPQSDEAIGEAKRSVEQLEKQQRQEHLLRETAPAPPRRPDLDEAVTSGIQQKAIEKALPTVSSLSAS